MTAPPAEAPPVAPVDPLARSRRRWWRWYLLGVSALLLAVGLTMGVVIGGGESAHATLHSTSAATALPVGVPASSPQPVWTSDDHAAVGNPLSVGTVVTWSAHQISGRDARTGAVRWFYRRTDATLCTAGQWQGRAFALFRHAGSCDELATFDSGTGSRGWYRTMVDIGNGVLSFGPAGLLVTYPGSVHAVAYDGIDLFPPYVQPSGCTVTSAMSGGLGILLTQHCADGDQLLLHANNTELKQPIWRTAVSTGVVAVTADQLIESYDPTTGRLTVRNPDDGKPTADPSTTPAPSGTFTGAVAQGGITISRIGNRILAQSAAGTIEWTATASGPVTLLPSDTTAVLVPTRTGAVQLDLPTGQPLSSYQFDAPSGTAVFPAGQGLLLAGATVSYLR